MILRAVLCILLLGAVPAQAQSDPAQAARAALEQMEQAALLLHEAEGAPDRVQALAAAIRAHESGLAAMREGLHQAAMREAQLSGQLQAREAEIGRLLAVLQTMGTASPPVLLLHPAGPLGSARSGMILADVTPALQTRAEQLRSDLQEVQTLRMLQQKAIETLRAGLAGVQEAQADLSRAMADRTDLPRRFSQDPVRTAILIASAETLDGFASGLSQISRTPIPPSDGDIAAQKGRIVLPVQGEVLHRFGERDGAGAKREGTILTTRPRALVTAPTAATIRYRGALLDLGHVMILEPQPETLFVLSGLAEVYGETGQVVPAGTPIGLMGGERPQIGAILSPRGNGTGTDRSETLYIEVREDGRPVDPETWFRTDKDG